MSDQQKTQIQDIFKSHQGEMGAIKNDSTLTDEQKKEKAKALHQSIDTQINQVLTPDQQQKWADLKAKHEGHK